MNNGGFKNKKNVELWDYYLRLFKKNFFDHKDAKKQKKKLKEDV